MVTLFARAPVFFPPRRITVAANGGSALCIEAYRFLLVTVGILSDSERKTAFRRVATMVVTKTTKTAVLLHAFHRLRGRLGFPPIVQTAPPTSVPQTANFKFPESCPLYSVTPRRLAPYAVRRIVCRSLRGSSDEARLVRPFGGNGISR